MREVMKMVYKTLPDEVMGWIFVGMGWVILIMIWLFKRGLGIVLSTTMCAISVLAFVVGILYIWKAIRGG